MAKKDLRQLVKRLEQQRFIVMRSKKSHYKVYKLTEQGLRFVATLPSSPSDWRSMKNTEQNLRTAGYEGTI